MDIELVQFSIVVVANDHNPSLINSDFLEREGIIDGKWGWKLAGDAITTPPFATVPYDAGITVTVETNKLQVVDQRSEAPTQSRLADIVNRYIEVLPHVPYLAVGINFNGAVKMSDPGTYLKKHFFKEGKWDSEETPLESVGLRLVYSLEEGRLVLTIDQAHRMGDKNDKVILVNANFHRDCDKEKPANAQIISFIKNIETDWKYYLSLVSNVLNQDA